jgi:predicted Zn finger-like uncharacterized protein
MPLSIECDHCGKRYRVNDSFAGRRVKCKICGLPIEVPAQPGEAEFTQSGEPIYRYKPWEGDFQLALGDLSAIEQIDAHITAHVGKVETISHEILSEFVHVDVHLVAPTEEKPYWTLITSGMSNLPMAIPEGAEAPRFAEVMISLPPDWPIHSKDGRHDWPIGWLRWLARFPHEYQTFLGWGHTVPNGDPAEPFADDTGLCCALLLNPALVPVDFLELRFDDEKTIHFYAFVPLYKEEVAFKLKHGSEPLVERLARIGATELLDVRRKNVCKKSLWRF